MVNNWRIKILEVFREWIKSLLPRGWFFAVIWWLLRKPANKETDDLKARLGGLARKVAVLEEMMEMGRGYL